MSGTSVLRAVANRLNSTPVEDLPSQVGYLATSISSCRTLLQNGSSSSDYGTLLHKLKTRVSALLQDRTPEGRLSGIVIAKAIAEAGGSAILLDSGNWIRAIISCLNKSDPPEVKKLGVLTVAHIYLSTAENQQLVREITTPTLPAFISATINTVKPRTSNIESKTVRALSPLLDVVLRSWNALLEHFPSTIRPNAASMRSICLSVVSDETSPSDTREAAYQVLARIHYCAPKNTAGTEWSQSCSQIIDAAHDTADLIFRAVVEDGTPSTNRISEVTRKQKSASVPATSSADSAGFDAWSGVSQGCFRITSQLDLLKHFLTNSQSAEVNVPLGALFDLTSRLSAITTPISKYSARTNNDITREEREELWLNLPRIHVSILELYHEMSVAFGQALYPVSNLISTQIWDILEAEHPHDMIRASIYQLTTAMLESRLIRFSKADSANVRLLVKLCCGDVSPTSPASTTQISLTNGSTEGTSQGDKTKQNSDLRQPKWKPTPITRNNQDLYSKAYALLPVLSTYGNLHLLEGSSTIRAQLDSTAILVNHHEAILASVLYPPGSSTATKRGTKKATTPSLIPFLARSMESGGATDMSNIQRLGYEAMLRPRMPVIPVRVGPHNDSHGNGEQDEESVVDEEDIVMLDEDTQSEQPGNADTLQETGRSVNDRHDLTASSESSRRSTTQLNSTKRDFTTLLEQSTDEQLAASATEHTPNAPTESNDNMLIPANKRPKTSDNANSAATLLQPSIPMTDPASAAEHLTQSSRLSINQTSPNAETNIPPQPPLTNTTTKYQQSSKHNDDDDDSSDSDVPLIDATLVGISDSEDEDEEDVQQA